MTAKQVKNWINTKEEAQEESISNPPKRPPINRINVDMEWHGLDLHWFATSEIVRGYPAGSYISGLAWSDTGCDSYNLIISGTFDIPACLFCFRCGCVLYVSTSLNLWIRHFFLNLDSLNSRRKMRWLQWSGEMRTSRSNSVRHPQRVPWHPVKWRMSEWVKNGSNGSKTIEIYDNLNNLDASLINI